MKKLYLTLITFLSAFQFTYAQWATSGSNIYNTNSGYVGIGTSSPAYPLDVQINTNSTTGIQFTNASAGTSARSRFTLNNGVTYAGLNLNGSAYPTDPNALEIFAPSGGGALIFGAGGIQWMRITQTGNVGIGTSIPTAPLHIASTVNASSVGIAANIVPTLVATANNNYLIGLVVAPTFTNGSYSGVSDRSAQFQGTVEIATGNLQIDAASNIEEINGFVIQPSSTAPIIRPWNASNYYFGLNNSTNILGMMTSGNLILQNGGTFTDAGYGFDFQKGATNGYLRAGANALIVNSSGNVLIGKNSQVNTSYILDVAGNARANEIVVNTSGADFVFDPTYKLRSLSSLERYIEYNHHLPEMASAKEMQADGLNLGDNQIKLLQKVEELTLYLIEKDKQVNNLQDEMNQLKQQINTITKTLNKN